MQYSILNLYYLQGDISDPLNANLSLINDALHRLETFQILQDIETNILSSDDAVTKEWIRFSQINLLKKFCTCAPFFHLLLKPCANTRIYIFPLKFPCFVESKTIGRAFFRELDLLF